MCNVYGQCWTKFGAVTVDNKTSAGQRQTDRQRTSFPLHSRHSCWSVGRMNDGHGAAAVPSLNLSWFSTLWDSQGKFALYITTTRSSRQWHFIVVERQINPTNPHTHIRRQPKERRRRRLQAWGDCPWLTGLVGSLDCNCKSRSESAKMDYIVFFLTDPVIKYIL